MTYKVVYVKLKKLPHNLSFYQCPNVNNIIENQQIRVQQHQNMILVDNSDSSFVERKNVINKMVNTETPEDLENEQKATFHYQVPRVRASFTLKVAPDSTTADLPEPTPTFKTTNSSNQKKPARDIGNKDELSSFESNLPQYGPHLPEYDPANTEIDHEIKDFRPLMTAKVPFINHLSQAPKPAIANKSDSNTHIDDKDFEIPLEESLKAVEDFIKREKELARWHIGEYVLAKWKGNGLYYKAKILEILPSGVVVIIYDSYDITEEIDYRDLCKFFKKSSNFKKKGTPEKPRVDLSKHKMSAKRQIKIKKRKKTWKNLSFVSVFKRSDRLRKRQLLASCKKTHHVTVIKSKNKANITANNKKLRKNC